MVLPKLLLLYYHLEYIIIIVLARFVLYKFVYFSIKRRKNVKYSYTNNNDGKRCYITTSISIKNCSEHYVRYITEIDLYRY